MIIVDGMSFSTVERMGLKKLFKVIDLSFLLAIQ
jgi:hypothetical protein